MYKILFGLALTIIIAQPAAAQDYRRNWLECAKEIGLNPDPTVVYKLKSDPSGRTLRGWQLHSEAQQAVFNDCLARKASVVDKSSTQSKPSAKGASRVSR
jgi:hypothetical protein